ncbi:cytochrome c oxidase subunit 6C-2-like [Amphiura filiformis]|uniref:cytochrome c oxidase subunit 6C-2-like n=1 Tax=Amphiura filiformis TaxID=82378 RepID=UPI003B214DF5
MSSSTPAETTKLPRPVLRSLLQNHLRKHLLIGFGLAIVGAAAWKLAVVDPRKRKFRAFWESYDAEKDFQRMKQLGVFHSARPDAGFEGMDLSSIDLKKK